MTALVSGPRFARWQLFAVASGLVVIASAGFVAWIELRIGGDQVTTGVDDIGEAVAAGIAAATCSLAAWRATGRLRVAWGLLAMSAASWCAGEIIWSVYEVGLGQSVPFPSAADLGFLAAMPLTVAGILTFSHTPRGTSVGIRLWLDRAIVFLALLFAGWELGLNTVFQQSADTPIDGAIALAYPLGDIAIATVLLLAIRRATDEQKGRLFLLLGGLAALAAADSAFAYLTASGAYGAIGSVLDAGWVVGYLVIALAALWPSGRRDVTREEKPIDIWQLVLPWLAILAASLTALFEAALGKPLDLFATILAGMVIGLVMVSQVLAHNESLALLIRSRLSAATLNQMIVYAPLGVVRIGTDMTILQANPTFAAMMRASIEELAGAPVGRFFSRSEMARASERFRELRGKPGITADFDTQATRADNTTVWLHWTASTVPKPTGALDYYLAMLEDISARRTAEEVAAANLLVLQRLNRVKSQFLTKVSHEFRTALVGIQGFSEVIRDADTLDVDEVKGFATDIYDDARRLDRSLNAMLALDSSESEHAVIHRVEVDLGQLILDAVSDAHRADTKHRITTELAALPHVAVDAELVGQVVTTLVGRALAYSPAGAAVRVSATELNDQVKVSVTDEGAASASDLDAQLLGRVGPDGPPARAGVLDSNVGLPMARQIVEMHGGRLWFENSSGTTWNFTLPVATAAAEPAVAEPR